jgi:hypothetical protein
MVPVPLALALVALKHVGGDPQHLGDLAGHGYEQAATPAVYSEHPPLLTRPHDRPR